MHPSKPPPDSLMIADLLARYRTGTSTPADVMERLLAADMNADPHHIWITRLTREQLKPYLAALEGRTPDDLPLYGVPFVIKDNIDLKDVPTTAGCPAYAYVPAHSATVVQKLIDAGAVPLGKTNLDQFATGLVGARSPYGASRNSMNPDYISGGSSGGSAVAVASGAASFSLGTDTAGSGRVPAAFNNLVGLKPGIGRLSTTGVVPACRSLDCVSIFALTTEDALRVLEIAQGFDAADGYSRPPRNSGLAGLRVGIPRHDQLEFFGDDEYSRLYNLSIETMKTLGGSPVEIDFAPFLSAARLLYEGPWLAERYAAVGEFMEAHPDEMHPVTRQVIEGGRHFTAAQAYQAQYALQDLKRRCEEAWGLMDVLMTPTAATIFTLQELAADPVALNSRLGYYTNFVNLFDLAGVAVPAGFRSDGLPFGVTLAGPSGTERALLQIAGRLHRAAVLSVGALQLELPAVSPASGPTPEGYLDIAVCGAHMQGLPLNHQLRDRGGFLREATRTAEIYRLLALPGGPPHRPGLIRVPSGGAAIDVEVWAVPLEHVGSFLAGIPAPLGLGRVELTGGRRAVGFICEAYAAESAVDITQHGGWRAYLDASED